MDFKLKIFLYTIKGKFIENLKIKLKLQSLIIKITVIIKLYYNSTVDIDLFLIID